MAAEIPAAGGLNGPPDWALAQVPGLEHGQRPLRLEPLPGGSVNRVYRVESTAGRFVVRLDGPSWQRPGVERGRELRLHQAAAAAGLAPRIVHAQPAAEGLLVLEFEEGATWRERDYADAAALGRLGERLGALHRLAPPSLPPFDPWQVAQQYLDAIAARHPGALGPAAVRAGLARLQQDCLQYRRDAAGRGRIVHGDLTAGNLLEGSRLWLLDFEYAQVADPLHDLACVLAYYPIARPHQRLLADAAGLGGAADAALECCIRIHLGLGWLWHLARGEAAAIPAGLEPSGAGIRTGGPAN